MDGSGPEVQVRIGWREWRELSMRSDEGKIGEQRSPKNEYTVEEVMDELDLCRKSVYNYISRGALSASKVNGMWVIQGESVRRVPRRRGRRKKERSKAEDLADRFLVDRKDYEELLRQAGKLRAMEELVWEYKQASEELERRVRNLEQELETYRRKGFWSRYFGKRRRSGRGRET